jgi:hypothetical protein
MYIALIFFTSFDSSIDEDTVTDFDLGVRLQSEDQVM